MIVQNLNFGLPNNYTLIFVIKPKMNAFVQSFNHSKTNICIV